MPVFTSCAAPRCPKCEKAVYFAERITALGKDWHRSCFRCSNEACKITLTAGKNSEHEGLPYCTRCHQAMFGPKGFGRGGSESHVFCDGKTGATNMIANNNRNTVE